MMILDARRTDQVDHLQKDHLRIDQLQIDHLQVYTYLPLWYVVQDLYPTDPN